MNWNVVETTLFDASVAALSRFAAEHSSEKFYGFCFDVNADYGEVLLSLNTEAGLRTTAQDYYPDYSASDVERELRWNAGDWKYQGFNVDEPSIEIAWNRAWSPTQEAIASATIEDDEVAEDFLESVCRVLIRLERSDAFRPLQREPHFKTLVADHDETLEDSWDRLARVRSEG
jgi:hypothetical protein